MLHLNLAIEHATWKPVVTIPKEQQLERGVKNAYNKKLLNAAKKIDDRFGVYSFQDTETGYVFYCGSFSPYKGKVTSLEGRLKQYLGNHENGTGKPNTNLRVFQNLNHQLLTSSVTLSLLQLNNTTIFDRSGSDLNMFRFSSPNQEILAQTLEQVFILYYKQHAEAPWNLP